MWVHRDSLKQYRIKPLTGWAIPSSSQEMAVQTDAIEGFSKHKDVPLLQESLPSIGAEVPALLFSPGGMQISRVKHKRTNRMVRVEASHATYCSEEEQY